MVRHREIQKAVTLIPSGAYVYEGRKRWVGDPGIGPVFLVVSTEVAGMTLFFVGFVYIEVCASLGVWQFINLYLTVGGAQYHVSRAPREA